MALVARGGCMCTAAAELCGADLASGLSWTRPQADLIRPGCAGTGRRGRVELVRSARRRDRAARVVTPGVHAPGAVVDWNALPRTAEGLRRAPVCTTFVDDQLTRTAQMIADGPPPAGAGVHRRPPPPAGSTAFSRCFLGLDRLAAR